MTAAHPSCPPPPPQASAIQVTRTQAPKTKAPNDKLVFGATMSDHMLEVDWHHESGWGAPRIVPYHALAIDPAASVLHYGIEAFEGMKAYRDDAGGIRLFRPDLNMARLANSMDRLAGPPLDRAGFTACLAELVRQEADWIPRGEGFSLYLRPTFISTWPYLGVTAGKSFKLYVITCPVGPYYPEGFKVRVRRGAGRGGRRRSQGREGGRGGARSQGGGKRKAGGHTTALFSCLTHHTHSQWLPPPPPLLACSPSSYSRAATTCARGRAAWATPRWAATTRRPSRCSAPPPSGATRRCCGCLATRAR